jgi:hypothetical protein
MVRLSGKTYDVRDEIKRVGGKYDAATKTWTVTDEQLVLLQEAAELSARRFNKRDTQFSRSWAGVVVEVQP